MADTKEANQQDTEMNIEDCSEEGKKINSGLCMSAGIETPTDSDQSRFQRRHFPNKMTSNIFFNDLPAEDNVSAKNNVDREENFPSAGTDTRYVDQKQSERRHFYSPSEDYIQPENNTDKDEEIDLSETAESSEIEIDDTDQKQTQRRHFHEKTNSNIFFCGLPPEDITGNRTDPCDFRKRKG